jgi:hypothetical protein
MYAVLEVLGFIAVIGWFRLRDRTLLVPFAFVLSFVAAMVYGTLVYYASTGVPNLPGWYLWPAACPLAIVYVAGARRFSMLLIVAFVLVDLYGVNAVMMPYYAGLVTRNHATLAGIPEALTRLHVPVWLWGAWIAASMAIPMVAQNIWIDRRSLEIRVRG